MRRRIAVLLAGLMVCSMLTACGSTEEPKGEPEAEQGETKEEARKRKNLKQRMNLRQAVTLQRRLRWMLL